MQYTIDTSQEIKLNWGASGKERIIQNVFNLVSTFKYEIAYNRAKGIDPSILDKPANVLEGAFIAEVYRVVEEYEPRATIKSVSLIGTDNDGNMQFKVVVDV